LSSETMNCTEDGFADLRLAMVSPQGR
jgi:hypothetical protein